MKSVITKSIDETQSFSRMYLNSLQSKDSEATILGLYGNLGSGKTAFTKCLAKELGINEEITSPTFVIMKLYETKNEKFKRLIHIDAYRLESGKELQTLDFESLVNNPNNLIVIEWPENVKEILNENHRKIHCNFIDENTRQYDVE